MNIDKLVEAIQILVREEVKRQLPKLLEEVVKNKKGNMVETSIVKKPGKISMTKAILETESNTSTNDEIQYSKNPIINKILNETRVTSSYPGSPIGDGYEEWPTMKTPISAGNLADDRISIQSKLAEKMGYGDIAQSSGLGVNTGNDVLDKAFNRDYTELVRRFKK